MDTELLPGSGSGIKVPDPELKFRIQIGLTFRIRVQIQYLAGIEPETVNCNRSGDQSQIVHKSNYLGPHHSDCPHTGMII